MKIEITVTKSKEDESLFSATASSGVFPAKKKLGTAVSAKEIGEQIADIIEDVSKEGLIGKK